MLNIGTNNSSYINFLLYLLAMPQSLFENTAKNVAYIIYVIFFNLLIVYGVYFELQGRTGSGKGINTSTSTIITFLGTVWLAFANVGISTSLLMNAERGCLKIRDKIEQFDVEIYKDPRKKPDEKNLMKIALILLINIFCILVFVVEVYVIKLSDELDTIYFHIWDNVLRYRLNIFVACIYFFIRELHQRIKYMNRTLRHIVASLDDDGRVGNQHSIANAALYLCKIPEATKRTSKAYGVVLEIVEEFNSIFGWLLLVLIVNYLVLCLVAFTIALQRRNYQEVDWIYLIWISMMIFTAATGAVSISSICNRTTTEAKKTAPLAYALLFGLNTKKDEDKSLVEDITLLVRKTTSYSPIFTAAGFFVIDYSGLFTLMNLLTSYVIVLIQFV
ncbi:hypothetical protein Trydic_g8576 [Trypoxylus dichotomus]